MHIEDVYLFCVLNNEVLGLSRSSYSSGMEQSALILWLQMCVVHPLVIDGFGTLVEW